VTKIAGLLGVLAVCGASGAVAQEPAADNMEILREKLAADKRLVVATNLTLTESQAQAFWPIYEEYQDGLEGINGRIEALVSDYAQMYNARSVTDAAATELLNELLAIKEAEVALMRQHAQRLNGVIPPLQVARYLQIENKIRAVINYDLAAAIPVVE
jgi:hypothetical protein